MIQFELTRRQTRCLRKYFDVVHEAWLLGERGMLVAQIHSTRDFGKWGGYVRVKFFPSKLAQPIFEAVIAAKIPNCYAGMPRSAFNG